MSSSSASKKEKLTVKEEPWIPLHEGVELDADLWKNSDAQLKKHLYIKELGASGNCFFYVIAGALNALRATAAAHTKNLQQVFI